MRLLQSLDKVRGKSVWFWTDAFSRHLLVPKHAWLGKRKGLKKLAVDSIRGVTTVGLLAFCIRESLSVGYFLHYVEYLATFLASTYPSLPHRCHYDTQKCLHLPWRITVVLHLRTPQHWRSACDNHSPMSEDGECLNTNKWRQKQSQPEPWSESGMWPFGGIACACVLTVVGVAPDRAGEKRNVDKILGSKSKVATITLLGPMQIEAGPHP